VGRIKVLETRAVQSWFQEDKLSGNLLNCVLQPNNCVTGYEIKIRRAGPKASYTFLLVDVDVVPLNAMSVVENEIGTLSTSSGLTLEPHLWFPLGPSWISAKSTINLQTGKKVTMRWLFEVPIAQLPGSKLKIWGKDFVVSDYR
jgi:hypothetical protein